MKIEFEEEQKFTQWWLWLILIPIGLLPIVGIYQQIILGEAFGENSMSDSGLVVFAVLIILFVSLFFVLSLKTEIDKNEVRINFFPFAKRKFSWKEIKKAEIVNYGFIGGWGIRRWTKYGTAYNVKGKMGLAIELLDGNKFLIGTQKEAELKKILGEIQLIK